VIQLWHNVPINTLQVISETSLSSRALAMVINKLCTICPRPLWPWP